MRSLATIGVYGFDLFSFLATLREADVGLLLDVRQRRGVRGREYRERYLCEILDRVDLTEIVIFYRSTEQARCCASSGTPSPATAR